MVAIKQKNIYKNEEGSILVLAIIFLLFCSVIFTYAVNLSRVQLARHKLFVATDLASLAAATQYDLDKLKNDNILELKTANNETCNMAKIYIDKNNISKENGTEGWLGIDGSQIMFDPNDKAINSFSGDEPDCFVDNDEDPNRHMAMVTIRARYIVKPFLFDGLFTDVPISAKSKSVIYLN